MKQPNTLPIKNAAPLTVGLRRLVSWLAEFVDEMPRWAKAVVAVWLIGNGIKAVCLVGITIFYAIVYLAVKAS